MKTFVRSIVAAICSIVMSIVAPIKAAVNKVATFFATVHAATKSDTFKDRVYPMVKYFAAVLFSYALIVLADVIAFYLLSVNALPENVAVVVSGMISGKYGVAFVTFTGLLFGTIIARILCRGEKYEKPREFIESIFKLVAFFYTMYAMIGHVLGADETSLDLTLAHVTAISAYLYMPTILKGFKKFFEDEQTQAT